MARGDGGNVPTRVWFQPRLQVSPEDAFQYDQLAASLLQDVLTEYTQFVTTNQRRLDPLRWRQWRQQDDIVIYKEHSDGMSLKMDRSGKLVATTPRLLAIGTIHGSLDDVMYASVTTTASAMRLKASYLSQRDFLDAVVLSELKSPTPSTPFQFLGLKWELKQVGSRLLGRRSVDSIYLEAAGIEPLPTNRSGNDRQRVGFHIQHSIEHEQCPEKPDGSVRRRKPFTTCLLYHEREPGLVEVFMTAQAQLSPSGSLNKNAAIKAADALLDAHWYALTICAENKKLAWLLQTHRQLQVTDPPELFLRRKRCGLCSKSLRNPLVRKISCQLCAATVCSQCSTTRTLRQESIARHEVLKSSMVFCKKCLALASEENSSDIARQELWEDHVLRAGRSNTILALASRRETVNGSASMATSMAASMVVPSQSVSWERRQNDLFSSELAASRRWNPGHSCSSMPTKGPNRNHRIGSWLCASEASRADTDALSSTHYDNQSEVDRASHSTSLVLLNSRRSSRRLENMDLVFQPSVAENPERSSVYTEIAVSEGTRTSIVSSIAVMELDRASFSTAKTTRSSGKVGWHPLHEERTVSDRFSYRQSPPLHPHSDPRSSMRSSRLTQSSEVQKQLWMQMHELRDTAESTYQAALRNTETLLAQNPEYRETLELLSQTPQLSIRYSFSSDKPTST
ncbi:hypothetical protein Poli38472_007325 [Pythium oligandrum]|uniref:FYVE-type domain-containing protein n=1 Tax=Pythium oligandrum TaxID=41045 RepID=A0A8K1CAB4_PYTOL|nr:hypothetical protein Poli38472_007325 [Pythium oligandrum]|eukprot:TMW59180.1 hypothetical protein Poli38472_007325 [Pythium oligandrum]